METKERGSTLLMAIITIMLLSVLGTALLSMSTMNVGMKYVDKDLKKTHYYAESGVEQAYGMVSKTVSTAVEDSAKQTATFIADLEVSLNQLERHSIQTILFVRAVKT